MLLQNKFLSAVIVVLNDPTNGLTADEQEATILKLERLRVLKGVYVRQPKTLLDTTITNVEKIVSELTKRFNQKIEYEGIVRYYYDIAHDETIDTVGRPLAHTSSSRRSVGSHSGHLHQRLAMEDRAEQAVGTRTRYDP